MAKELRITTLSVVVIIAAVALVALLGGHYSVMNRDWYDALTKPSWQPPNWVFPVVWNTIFILSAISLILIWNTRPRSGMTYVIMGAAVLNGILNIGWSWLFFGHKLIMPAAYDALLLWLSVLFILTLAWPISRVASILLIPYALWTAFATSLTSVINKLNP